jgi:hypothetical protein
MRLVAPSGGGATVVVVVVVVAGSVEYGVSTHPT